MIIRVYTFVRTRDRQCQRGRPFFVTGSRNAINRLRNFRSSRLEYAHGEEMIFYFFALNLRIYFIFNNFIEIIFISKYLYAMHNMCVKM